MRRCIIFNCLLNVALHNTSLPLHAACSLAISSSLHRFCWKSYTLHLCLYVFVMRLFFSTKAWSVKNHPLTKLMSKLMSRLKYLPYCPPALQGVPESQSRKTKTMEKAAAAEYEPLKRPSDKLFCCVSLRQRIPETLRDEVYHVIRMSVPLVRTVGKMLSRMQISPRHFFWFVLLVVFFEPVASLCPCARTRANS